MPEALSSSALTLFNEKPDVVIQKSVPVFDDFTVSQIALDSNKGSPPRN